MAKYKGISRYCHMVNPSKPKNSDKLSYSEVILIHKSDPQCAQITAEIEAAKKNGFPSGFPAAARTNWTDCAVTEPDNIALKDYMAFKASTDADQGMPVFVDAGLQPIIDPGMDGKITGKIVWIEAAVRSYPKGDGGVKAYLNGVMDTGEKGPIDPTLLSSRPDANSLFGDVANGAQTPATTQAPPGATTQPPPSIHQMTAKANGDTYEDLIANKWTDDMLIAHGLMLPPTATPSFAQ